MNKNEFYFIKIEGIDGEATDSDHEKWINFHSYSHGVSQPVSGSSSTGGRTSGGADFQNFTITKELDASTPDLNIYCCNGKHIPKIEIELCVQSNEKKHVLMKYELEDAIVSAVSPEGSEDQVKPVETVSIAYGKIKWEYQPIGHDGAPVAAIDRSWDLEKNTQV